MSKFVHLQTYRFTDLRVNLKDITPVILAGGKGTRLQSVVSDNPKVLAKVNDKPFIFYLFDQLIASGFNNVVLCTGYMAEMVKEICTNNYNGLSIKYSKEKTPLGTGGAIINALREIITPNILVMNGDSFCDFNLTEFIRSHFSYSKYSISIVTVEVKDISRYGNVIVSNDSFIEIFEEKSNIHTVGLVNGGIYLVNKFIFYEYSTKKFPISIEKDIFPDYRKKIFAYQSDGKFIDIGTPESYKTAATFFQLKGQSPKTALP